MAKSNVVVIGAGIMGLSTAIQIQEALPQATVTIVAECFNDMTTSDGAAGVFRPTLDHIPGVPRDLLIQWSKDSFQHYDKLVHSEQAKEAGASWITGYHLFINEDAEKDRVYRDIVYDSQPCSRAESNMLPGTENCQQAFKLTTVMIECRWYLPFLMKRFKANGGQVVKRRVSSLAEFAGQCDVLVNCSGLGAQQLAGDDKLQPNRGQMLRVKAPWIKHFLYVDHSCWIIPGIDTVTLGGTRQYGDGDPKLREAETQAILERVYTYMPSLKNAEVAWHWVGIRPSRNPVRVDSELIQYGSQTLKVVHNYGHGGNGIALGWGCSKHAARLACELLQPPASKI